MQAANLLTSTTLDDYYSHYLRICQISNDLQVDDLQDPISAKDCAILAGSMRSYKVKVVIALDSKGSNPEAAPLTPREELKGIQVLANFLRENGKEVSANAPAEKMLDLMDKLNTTFDTIDLGRPDARNTKVTLAI